MALTIAEAHAVTRLARYLDGTHADADARREALTGLDLLLGKASAALQLRVTVDEDALVARLEQLAVEEVA